MVRLQVAGRIEEREVALRTISAACRLALGGRRGARERAQRHTDDVVSAVGEAFNNIAIHGYAGCTPGVVEIALDVGRQRISVELRDYGRSCDPRRVPPPDLDALPESGLGAFIIRSLMDEVDYRPGRPNVLKLVKRLT